MKKKDADPKSIPEEILQQAIQEVNSKAEEHGDTAESFRMISELWSVYVNHARANREGPPVTPHDVAQMMILIKIARSVYGESEDNFIDTAGYAALAAMFKDSE
jgi:hypothetical protein